ncbi:unnamed protein product, partial [Penicillium palitans]
LVRFYYLSLGPWGKFGWGYCLKQLLPEEPKSRSNSTELEDLAFHLTEFESKSLPVDFNNA